MDKSGITKTWSKRPSPRLAVFAAVAGLVLAALTAADQVNWPAALALWIAVSLGAILLLRSSPRPFAGDDNISRDDARAPAARALTVPPTAGGLGSYRALLQSLPDPVLIIGGDGQILFDNDAARDLFGQALTGRSVAVLRQPDLLEAIEMVLEGSPIDSMDFSLPGKVALHMNARLSLIVEAEDGAADERQVILVLRDTTEIRQSERMRGDFVANVSHELRSPLASISGFVETLRGPARQDEEARDRFLAIMAEQSERMTNLIEDLLSLSRIELKEHQPPTTQVDLRDVVATVVEGLTLRAEEKDIDLRPTFGAATTIRGDRQELLQLVQNLVDNAIKYARPGSQVTITLGPEELDLRDEPDQGPANIVFSVNNRGDTIPREELPRLTERFYRVDAARSRALGGTGLGLAIVKHVANRHRAELGFTSSDSDGTTATCRFPL